LWLAFEQIPHPEAVVYGADEADARLAVTLLKAPLRERLWYADQLRGYLREQESLSPFERPGVACRERPGLFRVISWRFAKWLANVLPSDAGLIERTLGRIEGWLGEVINEP